MIIISSIYKLKKRIFSEEKNQKKEYLQTTEAAKSILKISEDIQKKIKIRSNKGNIKN